MLNNDLITKINNFTPETPSNTLNHTLFKQLNVNNKATENKPKFKDSNQNQSQSESQNQISRNSSKKSSLKAPLKTNLNIKENFKKQSDNSLIEVELTAQSANTITTTALPQKPKRTLKEMFSKVVNFSVNENQKNKKDVSQSKLAKLINEADAAPADNNKNKNIDKSDLNVKSTIKDEDNNRNKNDIIVGKVKPADKYFNDKINSNNNNSNAKANDENLFKIKTNKDEKKIILKEKVSTEMKNFVFNIIADETNDEYKCTTFFVKAENISGENERKNGIKNY